MKALILLVVACWSNIVYFVEVSRHGARGPNSFMPWDSSERWPYGEKNLLDEGLRQHYLLGCYLRSRYIKNRHFLQSTYNSTEIKVYSTSISRTVFSMQSQLLGLYPQHPFPNLNPHLPISTSPKTINAQGPKIPIFLDTSTIEPMLLAEDYCLPFKDHVKEQRLSLDYQKLIKKYKLLLAPISSYFQTTNDKSLSLFLEVLGSATSNQFMGYSIPFEFDENWVEKSQKLYIDLRKVLRYSNEYVQKFASSQFFNEIISQFDAKVNNATELKATLYSAHDTTLMNIFSTLNIPLDVQPPYAAMVLFELYLFGHKYYVQMLYNDKPVRIPTCGSEFCEYNEFRSYVMSRTFRNVTSACENLLVYARNIKIKTLIAEELEESSEHVDESEYSAVFINFSIMIIVIITLYFIIKKLPR